MWRKGTQPSLNSTCPYTLPSSGCLYIVNFGCGVSLIFLFPIMEYICQICLMDWKNNPKLFEAPPIKRQKLFLVPSLNLGFFLWAVRCSRVVGYQLQASVSRGLGLTSQWELFHHHVSKPGLACWRIWGAAFPAGDIEQTQPGAAQTRRIISLNRVLIADLWNDQLYKMVVVLSH